MSASRSFERQQRVNYGSSLSRARLPESCRSRTSLTGHERSFNHFVCTKQNRLWDRQTECFGSSQIDRELESCGLLDRQVLRRCATKDAIHIARCATEQVLGVNAIGNQPTVLDKWSRIVHCWHLVTCCQRDDRFAMN